MADPALSDEPKGRPRQADTSLLACLRDMRSSCGKQASFVKEKPLNQKCYSVQEDTPHWGKDHG